MLAAAAHGRELEAAGALFHAFFVDRRQHRRAPRCWPEIGGEVGLDPEEMATAAGPAAADAVVAAHERAFALGIAGVPVCVFGDDHVIAGAQPAEVLEALLDLEPTGSSCPAAVTLWPPRLVVARSRCALAAAPLVAGRHVGLRASR